MMALVQQLVGFIIGRDLHLVTEQGYLRRLLISIDSSRGKYKNCDTADGGLGYEE